MSTATDSEDTITARAIAFLEELCAISSPSGDLTGLKRMATRLADELARFGFRSTVIDHPAGEGSRQPLLVCRRGPAEGPYALLVGHLDTVLPAIAPRRVDGRLDGTGALDMKGGFAAFVGALDRLEEQGRAIPGDLVLVAVPDEEIGGPISEAAIREWGGRARCVLVLEPGERRDGAETLVTGRRGLVGWRLRARGRASHSGLAYWEGRSALAAAAQWCGRVQRLSEREQGPTVNVGRILGGDAEFVDDLADHHGLVGTKYRLNIVADRCVAEGELRFLTTGDRDRILERMGELTREVGDAFEVAMEMEVFESIAPVDPSGPGRELADELVACATRSGWRLELEHDRGGVSFPNFLSEPGRVPMLDGLGPVGGGMHTRGEFVELNSLRRRIDLLADLLERINT